MKEMNLKVGKMSEREEAEFWRRERPELYNGLVWKEVKYVPRASIGHRKHPRQLRLDERRIGILQLMSKRKGMAGSVILREMIRQSMDWGVK
jgi:hypothetical protein